MGNHQHPHKHQNCTTKDHHHPQKDQKITELSTSSNPNQVKGKIPHYGGPVTVDKINKVVVQQFEIQGEEYELFLNMLQMRKRLNHPNLITLRSYHIREQLSGCCPSPKNISKNVRLQYEPIMYSLQNQIKQYCAKKIPVQQSQVRRIFSQVVSCLKYLQDNKAFHGDIKPTTIMFNKNKQVKLIDSFLVNAGKTAFQIVLENQKSQSFLTPQQLQKSKFKKYQSLKNINKSDIFCVGMCMVEFMTFQSSMQAYDLMQMHFKPEFFQRKLKQMQEYGYSYKLADLSLRCMHKNIDQRPTFPQFLSQI